MVATGGWRGRPNKETQLLTRLGATLAYLSSHLFEYNKSRIQLTTCAALEQRSQLLARHNYSGERKASKRCHRRLGELCSPYHLIIRANRWYSAPGAGAAL